MLKVWRLFLSKLNESQQLKWSESFLDGQFRSGEKGDTEVRTAKRCKRAKWMVVVDGAGVPSGDHLHSVSP